MGPAKRDNPERNVTKSNVPQQLIFTASLVLLLMYQKLNSNALCNTFSFSEIHWVPTLVISKPKLRASLSLQTVSEDIRALSTCPEGPYTHKIKQYHYKNKLYQIIQIFKAQTLLLHLHWILKLPHLYTGIIQHTLLYFLS